MRVFNDTKKNNTREINMKRECYIRRMKRKNMNTQNTLNASINDVENKRTVRDKIVEYLYRVEIVSDSITLLLLQQIIDVLQKRVDQSSLNVIAKNSILNNILQQMQTLIVKFEAKSNYSKIIRKIIDLVQIFTSMMRIVKKTISSLNKNRQTREFIVIMIDVVEKKNLKIMFTKDIMNKLQNDAKSIQDVTRLVNNAIKIQAKSTKTRKIL
jgi:hypothetical protein